MSFQVDNNFNTQQSQFYESTNQYQQPFNSTNTTNLPNSNDLLAKIFSDLAKIFSATAGSHPLDALTKKLFSGSQQRVEDYGGFKFKNEAEKAKIDQAIAELRAEQAANPGKKVSKKFKIGKYKYRVTLDENGQLHLKRKKKKRGFFSKIGSAFKKIGKGIGKVLKKALPIVSTIGMFIPGLQPLAIAARVATGVMGVVNGIKSGNIFGAVMSGVGALSGVGGKVGSFFSNISNKATSFLSNAGSNFLSKLGTTGSWLSNTFSKASSWINTGKNWLSNFTGNMGNKVSDFLFKEGSGILQNLTRSAGGRFGQWLTQRGPDLLRSFANSMGQRATDWLNQKASNVLNRLMDNPIARRFTNLLNSPLGQILATMFRGNGQV